ncbi:MAG: phosphoribosylformylglycinamidine synthase subunit PurQ, partial [Erysipelotrichaceae bacterium]|nr:phosphoribosylformylglycinamidine synthase subunit PurQ [Erysipelotrichaceae bacterium]
ADIISPEFKGSGHKVVLLEPAYDENGLPVTESLKAIFDEANAMIASGQALSAYALGMGGILEAVFKMAIGNGYGLDFEELSEDEISAYKYGSILLECVEDDKHRLIGTTNDNQSLCYKGEEIALAEILKPYEDRLEGVYSCNIKTSGKAENISSDIRAKILSPMPTAKPKVLIPVFPGTNCEYDSAKAIRDAGGLPEIVVINNLNALGIKESVDIFANKLKDSQMIFIPGGFSGGDEPDGSGKFITAFFRNEAIKDGVEDLMDQRGGLICGICNGFQALIKLGLVPYGKIVEMDDSMATLTYNTIGRHQSKIVRTRIASTLSPWLAKCQVGDICNVPISHGEGRFLASDELLKQLIENGQVATQYVDLEGNATMDIQYNPNGSVMAIEGITSPDGRVFGKMGHSERIGKGLYKNVPGNYDIRMFEAAVDFFKKQ